MNQNALNSLQGISSGQRENYITAHINRIQSSLKTIQGAINTLEERLGVVLRNTDTAPPEPKSTAAPDMTELAETLMNLADDAGNAGYRLGNIIERIELPLRSKPGTTPDYRAYPSLQAIG